MIIASFLGALIMALWLFPERAASRIVAHAIEPLAKWLMRVERRHLLFILLMAAVLIFASELLAIGGPLDAGLIVMWDISTYIDIIMVASLTTVPSRMVAGWHLAKSRAGLLFSGRRQHARRARAVRSRPKRPKTPANDEDGPPRLRWVV